MTKTFIAVVLLAVAVATAASAGASSGSPSQKPLLRLVDTQPLTLRGVNFESRETISLSLRAETRVLRRTTATTAGSFEAKFPGIDANRCEGFAVTAVGSDGSKATYKRAQGQCARLDLS